MAQHQGMIRATVLIEAPEPLTVDDLNNVWVEWLSFISLRGWSYDGSHAEFGLID